MRCCDSAGGLEHHCGDADACSHTMWEAVGDGHGLFPRGWMNLSLSVCVHATTWLWTARRPVCTAQEKARPFLANPWLWIPTLAPHPKCCFPLKGHIQMSVLMCLHLKIWSLMYLSSVFYRYTHIISKASFAYRFVSHRWPASGLLARAWLAAEKSGLTLFLDSAKAKLMENQHVCCKFCVVNTYNILKVQNNRKAGRVKRQ